MVAPGVDVYIDRKAVFEIARVGGEDRENVAYLGSFGKKKERLIFNLPCPLPAWIDFAEY